MSFINKPSYISYEHKFIRLNNDISEIIGDYVKKENIERMKKICKKYVKLY